MRGASTAPCVQGEQEALLDAFLGGALQENITIGQAMVTAQRKAAKRAAFAGEGLDRQRILDTLRTYTVLGDPAMLLMKPASGEPPVPGR